MALLSMLLLAALLPNLSHSANINVGIVNGKLTRDDSRLYMVSIQIGDRHECGGFLVSNHFVMTAAHCYKGWVLTVVVGAHDLSNREGFLRMEVESYYLHPQFNPETLDNDIMLLKLNGAVKKSRTVNYISIDQTHEDIPVNTLCSVAGWGREGSNTPLSNRLMETHIVITDRIQCSKQWNSTYPVTDSKVCASSPATCQGDSGGPLVCGNTAMGIVSFGEEVCENPGKPNVYTRISAFLPWIESIIKNV
ncbi:mast cell protease 1A-like [Hoplias malabaricus]|uniref:mast cell protease 1A-like n=1 Tax=Hoplias malabaricus TaxID=27720 RepID=UPI003461B304